MFSKLLSISTNDIPVEVNCSTVKDYIVSDGTGKRRPLFLKKPTAIDGIGFVLCTRGISRAKINNTIYTIKRRTLVTLLPNSICESVGSSDDYSFEYLFFSLDFIYELNIPFDIKLLELVSRSPLVDLTDEQFDCLMDFHAFIVKHYKNENHLYRIQLAKNLLASFITEMCDIYNNLTELNNDVSGRKIEICHQFFRLVVDHIKRERTVQFYADKICVTPKYLSLLVKNISGRPIMEWINKITIIVIKSMLKTSTLSISQISDELNFPNPSFFCRYFKKHTGVTPLQYREK